MGVLESLSEYVNLASAACTETGSVVCSFALYSSSLYMSDLTPSVCPCRYEWVDVGMLEYDPTSKLYLVKRVHVPSHILEEVASREKDGEEKGSYEL